MDQEPAAIDRSGRPRRSVLRPLLLGLALLPVGLAIGAIAPAAAGAGESHRQPPVGDPAVGGASDAPPANSDERAASVGLATTTSSTDATDATDAATGSSRPAPSGTDAAATATTAAPAAPTGAPADAAPSRTVGSPSTTPPSPAAGPSSTGSGTIVLQAVVCDAWGEVPGNFVPESLRPGQDQTAGRYRQWGPAAVEAVRPVGVDGAVPDGCGLLDGVQFRLSGTEYGNGLFPAAGQVTNPFYDPSATSATGRTTGADGAGTLDVPIDSLSTLQRQSLVDPQIGLWVQAVTPGVEQGFANLRCHTDRVYADNLEVIRTTRDDLSRTLTCVLYLVATGPNLQQLPGVVDPPVVAGPSTGVSVDPPAIPAVDAPVFEPPAAPADPTVQQPVDTAVVDRPASQPSTSPSTVAPAPVAADLVPDVDQSVLGDDATADPLGPAVTAPPSSSTEPSLPFSDTFEPTTTSVVPAPSPGERTTATTITTGPVLVPEPTVPPPSTEFAAGPQADAPSGLSVAAATGLGLVFLAGLALTVMATRRPL